MTHLGYSELTKRIYILPSSAKRQKIDITDDVMECVKFLLKDSDIIYKENKTSTESLYYIQNTKAGYLGNSIMFWDKSNSGYTAKLEHAKQFTYKEAEELCLSDPNKFKAWPVEYIDNNNGTCKQTDSQFLDNKEIVNFY